jgi:hypothetical protein
MAAIPAIAVAAWKYRLPVIPAMLTWHRTHHHWGTT